MTVTRLTALAGVSVSALLISLHALQSIPRQSAAHGDELRKLRSDINLLISAVQKQEDDIPCSSSLVTLTARQNNIITLRANNLSTSISSRESFEFFDYDDAEWAMKKNIVAYQNARQVNRAGRFLDGRSFYQNNWEPNWSCGYEQRIGRPGDGGKWVCDPFRIAQKPANQECFILSVGSENDFSFENEVHKVNPNCVIHTFDHTISPTTVPSYVKFHPWGLGSYNAGPIKTFPTILKDLGLLNKQIDILKIDCEGCEFTIFKQFFWNEGFFRQILIEMHFAKGSLPSFVAVRSPSRGAPVPTAPISKIIQANHDVFEAFQNNGYVLFHKEPNIQHSGGDCTEFSFLKLNLSSL